MQSALELWLTIFVIDTLRYLIGAGGVSLVLLGLFAAFSRRRYIQARRATAADIRREIRYSLQTTAVYAAVALATVHLEQIGALRYYADWSAYPLWYTLLSLPLLLVLHDTYFYWVHRAMHHRILFRWMHLAHHRSHTPTPWAAYAFAPGEAVVMALFVPLAAWLIPIHGAVLFTFLAVMIVRNAMGHSGVEFHTPGWVDGPLDCLTTVVHHDLHHQRARGHYGLYFTWWDRWMGTEFPDYKARYRAITSAQPAPAEASA